MPAPAVVAELVERFQTHGDIYRSADYNEAQLRQDFLNPFFQALGWDVYNRQGYAQPYREVIHEAALKVGAHAPGEDGHPAPDRGHRPADRPPGL